MNDDANKCEGKLKFFRTNTWKNFKFLKRVFISAMKCKVFWTLNNT